MGKRTREQVQTPTEQDGPDIKRSKRSRQEKREKAHDETPADGIEESKAARKERRKEEKRRRRKQNLPEELNSLANGDHKPATVHSEDDSSTKIKATKASERKASKPHKTVRHQNSTEGALTPEGAVTPEVAHNMLQDAYQQDQSLSNLPQAEIQNYLATNLISITDPRKADLRPLMKFSYLPFSASMQAKLFEGFKIPTPIQAAAWPFLFAHRDVIGVAETGSGKTMAFAAPCVHSISSLPSTQRNRGVRALVVSPTRELAMQSYEQILKLAQPFEVPVVCVYGGVPKDSQRSLLKTAEIVVATPGRLNDLINEGYADLSKSTYVVLDEADRMLDKGFEEDIRRIVSTTPKRGARQTLMFTATWPESVRSLAATFMSDPVRINIGDNPTGDLRANARIKQEVEVVEPRNKEYRLLQLLKKYQTSSQKEHRVLVFCLYKKEATRVESFVKSKGFRVASIHGDLSQEQRTRSLDNFKQGKCSVLVATDVAARGLDIPDVPVVINCTFPLTVEDYVHRIGRTGRAGKEGLAITLFTEHDKAQSGSLINVLKAANQTVPPELLKFGTTVKKKEHGSYGAFFKDVDTTKVAQKITFD